MQLVGTLLMILAAVVWIVGGFTVRGQYFRRTAQPKLVFDRSRWFLLKKFNATERAKLLKVALAAAALFLLGSALASGEFG